MNEKFLKTHTSFQQCKIDRLANRGAQAWLDFGSTPR